MVRNKKDDLKKITLYFDQESESDKKILSDLNNYIKEYSEKYELIYKSKRGLEKRVNESIALKKYLENKGQLKLDEEIVSALSEEKFYDYAHQAHCKKTGVEIGKYEFFRSELHKYKDAELKKMVAYLFI